MSQHIIILFILNFLPNVKSSPCYEYKRVGGDYKTEERDNGSETWTWLQYDDVDFNFHCKWYMTWGYNLSQVIEETHELMNYSKFACLYPPPYRNFEGEPCRDCKPGHCDYSGGTLGLILILVASFGGIIIITCGCLICDEKYHRESLIYNEKYNEERRQLIDPTSKQIEVEMRNIN